LSLLNLSRKFIFKIHVELLLYLIIGNIGNPTINRWGFNQFWRHLWYTDKNFYQKLQQDKIFNNLIYFYLHYGALSHTNIFVTKRWSLSSYYNVIKKRPLIDSKYFRIVYFKNEMLETPASYRLRIRLKNTHITKIWIFRYQNWLIINFYAFQPSKSLQQRKSWLRNRTKFANLAAFAHPVSGTGFRRLKMIITYVFFKQNSNSLNYYYNF